MPRANWLPPEELTMTAVTADVVRGRLANGGVTRAELVALIDSHMRTIDGLLLRSDTENEIQKEALHIAALAVRITENR